MTTTHDSDCGAAIAANLTILYQAGLIGATLRDCLQGEDAAADASERTLRIPLQGLADDLEARIRAGHSLREAGLMLLADGWYARLRDWGMRQADHLAALACWDDGASTAYRGAGRKSANLADLDCRAMGRG